MKEITLEEFLNCYKPTCNDCTPYPNGLLKDTFGNTIWDKREFSRIASNLRDKTIWTIFEDDSSYYIIATVVPGMNGNLVGFIVCEHPYEGKDIGRLKVVINK